MTFLEKMQDEGLQYPKGVYGCPSDYGLESREQASCAIMDCASCWNREMPETEPTPKNEPTGDGDADKANEHPEHVNDPVNHPTHYTAGGIECIDATSAALTCQKDPMQAWLTGQVLKYLWRWPLKNGVEDLKKAQFYLNRLIGDLEETASN